MGIGALAFRPFTWQGISELQQSELLGRITVGKVDVYAHPDVNRQLVGARYEDQVVPWIREVVGARLGRINQRWVETPHGYIWGGHLQPVRNLPNSPVSTLPNTSLDPGMWVEVTVPYVDLILDNPPARAPWLQYRESISLPARFFYSQVVWVDQVRTETDGRVWYRLNERFGSGDLFWGPAEPFRPLTADEIAPINPEAEEKRIVVNIDYQSLSCFEGKNEVYFARISSGALYDAWGNPMDAWATPVGEFPIWRKAISLPLSGGSASAGWSLPAVGWVSLFVGSGVAIHSTYWHNNYGEPLSRGCVNASPEDAKWVFSGDRMGETSESIRRRVQAARNIQQQRFASSQSDIICNADMRVGELRQFCKLEAEGQSLMRAAMSQLNLSARAYHRILKLSRTIADLAGSEDIQSPHLAEALQYRPKMMVG